jgi:hypothetical protein
LASDALTTAVPFGALSSGSAVRFLSEEYSIVIHRNIRFLLSLMVNVKCRCRIKFRFTSGRGPGIRNTMMSDFTPRAQQVLVLARKEAEGSSIITLELNTCYSD